MNRYFSVLNEALNKSVPDMRYISGFLTTISFKPIGRHNVDEYKKYLGAIKGSTNDEILDLYNTHKTAYKNDKYSIAYFKKLPDFYKHDLFNEYKKHVDAFAPPNEIHNMASKYSQRLEDQHKEFMENWEKQKAEKAAAEEAAKKKEAEIARRISDDEANARETLKDHRTQQEKDLAEKQEAERIKKERIAAAEKELTNKLEKQKRQGERELISMRNTHINNLSNNINKMHDNMQNNIAAQRHSNQPITGLKLNNSGLSWKGKLGVGAGLGLTAAGLYAAKKIRDSKNK